MGAAVGGGGVWGGSATEGVCDGVCDGDGDGVSVGDKDVEGLR